MRASLALSSSNSWRSFADIVTGRSTTPDEERSRLLPFAALAACGLPAFAVAALAFRARVLWVDDMVSVQEEMGER